MANWTQTIKMNSDLAACLIEAQTGLSVSSIADFGEGWDNKSYLINKKFVFRFPSREFGVACMENEIVLLPVIAKQVSFQIPLPLYIGHPTPSYPYHFAGYELINGAPLCNVEIDTTNNKEIAQTLGLWLRELHAISVNNEDRKKIKDIPIQRYDVQSRIKRSSETIRYFDTYFKNEGFDPNTLVMALQKFSKLNFVDLNHNSYVHGDLYSKHLLIDDNKKLSGIIDWGDTHIGNAAIDLSVAYMLFSDNALRAFFEAYGTSENNVSAFAIFRALCHPIALLPYCHEKNEKELGTWTSFALKRSLEYVANKL
jgi:aminoglycoside phosphotransferase (APT) family kinase protein